MSGVISLCLKKKRNVKREGAKIKISFHQLFKNRKNFVGLFTFVKPFVLQVEA